MQWKRVAFLAAALLAGWLLYSNLPLREPTTNEGVFLGSEDLSGLTEAEVRMRVGAISEEYRFDPVPAKEDPEFGGIIPHLNGARLDVEKTVVKVMSAPPQTILDPVIEIIEPAVTTGSLMPAPIYRGSDTRPYLSLMINVAWGDEYLPEMLDILSEEGIGASFFFEGRWVGHSNESRQLAKRIADRGHDVANHSYSHPQMSGLSKEEIVKEIELASEIIKENTGVKPVLFSPPSRDYNDLVVETAHELGYITVVNSLDTADWMRPGVEKMVRRVVDNVHNGGTILFHPTEQSAEGLRRIVSELTAKGYRFVPVSDLISPDPFSATPLRAPFGARDGDQART